MKKLIALATLSSLIAPQAAIAQSFIGYQERVCYVEEYEEVYIPGNRYRRGYVDYRVVEREVPCQRRPLDTSNVGPWNPNQPQYIPRGNVDDNSCIEGSIIGGILGGAAVAAGSRGPDMAWAIPLGVVGGGLIGCQIDGG